MQRSIAVNKLSILLVEDDLTLAYFMRRKLYHLGYRAGVVDNISLGMESALSNKYDLIILDLGLPDGSGIKLLEKMRERKLKTPVIIVTGDETPGKEIMSFKSGANLFHRKPVDFALLEAQVTSLLGNAQEMNSIKLGDLYIEPKKHYLVKDGSEIALTNKEFMLVLHLVLAAGDVLSREDILNLTQKGFKESDEGSVDTLISRVRKKIGYYKGDPVIETIHGRGFRLNLSYFKQ